MPWWPRWPDVHDSREPPGLRLPCLTRIFQNLAKRQNRRLLFAISTKIFIKQTFSFLAYSLE
ncbi:hypothetical protein GY15_04905 [Delftia sp. 670]|nr:hypothetical protein GY15_04905 [Delftia sp. 670]KLO59842.1 hypothetical protein AA671_09900 [Delftia tsuruhatensis]PZP65494.1 MAG: hypothetical protein DI604_24170 [Delftia acidovorans]